MRPEEGSGAKLRDARWYCENLLYIRDKKKKLVPLRLKPAQENLYRIIQEERAAGRPVRLIVLKGRQEGISTVVEGLMFQHAATTPLVRTTIVAHRDDATANLFAMNKLFYDCLPHALQPMRKNSNAKELVFENPTRDGKRKRRNPGLRSRIRCVTAGGKGAGRSDTLTNLHLSEFAFWPGDKMRMLLGITQAVPDDADTMIVIESTANGMDAFKELWDGAQAGENEWRPVFLPWYMEPEYRKAVPEGTEWSEEEEKLRREYDLDDEQLAWRRWCIRTNCGGDARLFRQEYPNTPDEAFLLSGDPYFDNEVLMVLRRRAAGPLRVGRFHFPEPDSRGGAPRPWHFADEAKGDIRIYKEPERGAPYVIGGDTAGEGSDRFTAFVIDNRTGEQVAELQREASEIEYARQIYCLGRYYNDALVGVEVNFSTYPEMKLEEWNYPNLYQRERFDTFANQMVKSFGWATNRQTRSVMLAGLHTVMEGTPEAIKSYETLGEMLTFAYNKDRRPEASPGEHDDLVMAAAICYQIRTQQRCTDEPVRAGADTWTKDMWEDYGRADAATRKHLIELWGRPKGGRYGE